MDALRLQQAINTLRQGHALEPEILSIRKSVKVFQNRRLEHTHHNLLEEKHTRVAGRFFLDRLYSPEPTHQRDQQVERILPKAQKYLPTAGLEVIQQVLEMDLLAEKMDTAMAIALRAKGYRADVELDKESYLQAFISVSEYQTRAQQIAMVSAVGGRLVKLMRFPLLKSILAMTRGAAHKANLEDFHEFLEDGVAAFKTLKSPEEFFQSIEKKEKLLLTLISENRIHEIPSVYFGDL